MFMSRQDSSTAVFCLHLQPTRIADKGRYTSKQTRKTADAVFGETRTYTDLCRASGDCMGANKSGVYSISNGRNGKRYIGSTVNFTSRWKAHRLNLKAGKHHSIHLQRAWDQDGESSFAFEVLETCPPSDLACREQYWIDHFHAANDRYGYNIAPRSYTTLGVKASPDARRRMSVERTGSKNANALLAEGQVTEIKSLLAGGMTVASLAKQFGVSYFVVWDIAVGKRWKHVEVEGFSPRKMGPPSGEANGQAKMTTAEVAHIKERLVSGENWIQIAESLGLDRRAVHEIQTGKKWKTVQVDGFTPKVPSDQKGSKHPHAKLTEADVIAIRQANTEGRTGISLAEEYGVTRSVISRIVTRKSWDHI